MGRLGCKCGKVLSNVDCPSDVDLCAFEGIIIDELRRDNPNITLMDVVLDYDITQYYFWYCRDCGRVYVFNANQQQCNKVYARCELQKSQDQIDLSKMRKMYFYTDRQIELLTEKDIDITLKDFFKDPPHFFEFYIDEKMDVVFVYNLKEQKVDFCYYSEWQR